MTAIAIIQGRMGSTRLQGKVLQPLGEHPAIWHTIQRALQSVPRVVVATTAEAENDPLAAYVATLDIPCYRYAGPKLSNGRNDVLARFFNCVVDYPADVVVRLTADCPFIQPDLIKAYAITAAMSGTYCGNVDEPHLCRGFDVEAFPVGQLVAAHRLAIVHFDREHVTPWLRRQAGHSTTNQVRPTWPRFTLDTVEDLHWLRFVAGKVPLDPPNPTPNHLLAVAHEHAPTEEVAKAKGWL